MKQIVLIITSLFFINVAAFSQSKKELIAQNQKIESMNRELAQQNDSLKKINTTLRERNLDLSILNERLKSEKKILSDSLDTLNSKTGALQIIKKEPMRFGSGGDPDGRTRLNNVEYKFPSDIPNGIIYLKLIVDELGNVISAENLKKTIINDQVLINEVIEAVKSQVKYNKKIGAEPFIIYYTIRVKN